MKSTRNNPMGDRVVKSSNQSIMEKIGDLHLAVGQLAEMNTFDKGFRGAWFRCEIKDVCLEKNKILLEYYDFEEKQISWTKIYKVPQYGPKSIRINKQLMLRPRYPLICHKNEMPPVNSISEVSVIIDGTWKVGDLVDWFEDSSYWTATVIEVLSDDMVQIELSTSPAGEGGTHEAFCKDLRPSLNWSAENGWTLATMDGQSSCSAQLIFPSQQYCMGSEREDTSSTSRISAAIEGDRETQEEANKMNSEQLKMAAAISSSSSSSSSFSSEDSISTTLHVEESNEEVVVGSAEYSSTELNMMHEATLEATISDLEELANRIKWIKSILETNQDETPSSHWQFN